MSSGDPDRVDAGDAAESAAQSSATLVGARLGEYQVLRKLGRGGMADVYAAKQLNLNRDVAIKVLRKEFSADAGYVQRFRREARAAAKLNHPNLVGVYDVQSIEDIHFIAQELVDGPNLRQRLRSDGPIDADEAVQVLLAVGEALQVAAEAGITHRDIKPENIMRSSRGVYKVADFGLARLVQDGGSSHASLTQAGLTLGTPRYMSPEQIQGKAVDSRSDLYSLGVSLYHLLTGRPPFEADDPLALAVMHLHDTPPPIDQARGRDDLPEWLIAIVTRLMNKSASDRYASPAELLAAVRRESSPPTADGSDSGLTATARLQRVTALAAVQRRRQRLRRVIAIALPLCVGAVAAAWAATSPGPSLSEVLYPDQVDRKETVEAQFIEAVRRNDAAGWQAVAEYFPAADNATNRSYAIKSRLQYARLLIEQAAKEQSAAANDASGRNGLDQAGYGQADRVLRELTGNPDLRGEYLAYAAVLDVRIAEASGDPSRINQAKQRASDIVRTLRRESPERYNVLEQAFTPAELFAAGVAQ